MSNFTILGTVVSLEIHSTDLEFDIDCSFPS